MFCYIAQPFLKYYYILRSGDSWRLWWLLGCHISSFQLCQGFTQYLHFLDPLWYLAVLFFLSTTFVFFPSSQLLFSDCIGLLSNLIIIGSLSCIAFVEWNRISGGFATVAMPAVDTVFFQCTSQVPGDFYLSIIKYMSFNSVISDWFWPCKLNVGLLMLGILAIS